MEKRRHPRIALKNLCVDVSDGVGFFTGTISDFSRFGFCMTDLPKRLNGKVNKMIVVISGQGKNFKMNVVPRWSADNNPTKSVGAEILNAPWSWTEFAMKYEPVDQDKCVWDSVHI